MPGRPRHKKGKHIVQSKKRKDRLSHPTPLASEARAVQTEEAVSPPVVRSPSINAPIPMPEPAVIRYPYISAELRTISILAGIMLILLIVLASVLS